MKRANWFSLGLITVIVLLDQVTKQLIARTMDLGDQIVVIPNFITITSHRNIGAAWGIFSGNMTFLYLITILAGFLFYYLLKDADLKHKTLYTIGIVLMIAGGIGNFIDRALFQEVIDFIDIDLWSYTTFPIFNVADIALVVGMIAFALDILLEDVIKWKRSKSQTDNQKND